MIKVDGRKISDRIKAQIRDLMVPSEPKSLAIFYVGQNPVIESFVSMKKRFGEELGIEVTVIKFDESVEENFLIEEIKKASQGSSGIIIQLPLPENLNRENILNAVPKNLDVDVLSTDGYADFKMGQSQKMPPVAAAVREICLEEGIDLENKNIVLVGRGLLVGKPIGDWLAREGHDYKVADKDNLSQMTINADIIISGAGVPSLITPGIIKEGVILIDAGTSNEGGKLVGDISTDCYEKASIVSPVPGGVGPITVASLFRNLFLK